MTWGNLLFLNKSISVLTEYIYTVDHLDNLIEAKDLNFGITTNFSLPFKYTYSPNLRLLTSHDNYFLEIFNLRFDNTFTHNKINWIDNQREGYSLTIKHTDILPLNKGALTDTFISDIDSYTTCSFTAFKTLGSRINPGVRFQGYIANGSKQYLMPEGQLIPGEYMRGILTNSLPAQGYGYAGAILNTNISLKLIDIGGLVECFFSPFFDIMFFNPNAVEDGFFINHFDVKKSIGFDAYMILDKYRSYPFRATAGANFDHLAEFFKGQRKLESVEIEIILALDLFY